MVTEDATRKARMDPDASEETAAKEMWRHQGRASYVVCVTSRAADSLQGKIVILGHLVSLGNSHIGTVVDLSSGNAGAGYIQGIISRALL